MSTIRKLIYNDDTGAPQDVTSVVLSNDTGTIGVIRDDTGASIVTPGTALFHPDTGVYTYTFADPAYGLTYVYWLKITDGAAVYYLQNTLLGPTLDSDLATTADVCAYIKRTLGWPTVVVELDDTQLNDCVLDALRLFNRYLQVVKSNVSKDRSTGTYIVLDADVRGVYDVKFLWGEAQRDILKMNVFEILTRMSYPPFALGEWYMLRQYYEMFQRLRGSDPDWRYDPESRRLYLDCYSGPYDVCYLTSHDITVASILAGSRKRYLSEFLATCTAYAKKRVAYIRRRFGGVPAPAGTLALDGDAMAAEADTVLTDIEQRLQKHSRAHYLPIIG